MKEEWKDIEGYEGLYQISNFGRVKSFHGEKERILTPRSNKGGHFYPRVALYKNGKAYSAKIHRLVGKAFILNTENRPQLNHRNGDRTDCSVGNLEWVTASENQKHAYKLKKLREER